MQYNIFPAVVTHAVLLVIALSMGLLIYIHDRKSITNKFFLGLSISIFFWAVANFLSFYFGLVKLNLDYAMVAVKFDMVCAALITIFMGLFVYAFPKAEVLFSQKQKILIFIGSLIYSIASYFTWEGWILDKPTPAGQMPVTIPNLPLLPMWGVVTLGVSVLSCVYLVMKYRRSEGDDRARYLSAVVGLSSAFVLLPLLLFVPVALFGDSRLNYFGPIAYIPIFYGVGYGIVRHKIFNVRLLTTEILILAAILLLFFNIFI